MIVICQTLSSITCKSTHLNLFKAFRPPWDFNQGTPGPGHKYPLGFVFLTLNVKHHNPTHPKDTFT